MKRKILEQTFSSEDSMKQREAWMSYFMLRLDRYNSHRVVELKTKKSNFIQGALVDLAIKYENNDFHKLLFPRIDLVNMDSEVIPVMLEEIIHIKETANDLDISDYRSRGIAKRITEDEYTN
ncbi:hypothetical protein [Leptospira licerasiae]|uniref:hypothetical protein n=1 Tax=Leptospira licerasiae TaxID=447106 RepID=UPI00301678E2